jgi:hypothetical protein
MRGKILGFLSVMLLGISGGASANDLYFLTVPSIEGYTVVGTITTDGASTLGDADVVDYEITLYSGPPSASYTLTPANSTFSWSGVTASLSGLIAGVQESDTFDVASNLLCLSGTFECYGLSMFNDPYTGHRLFYVVLGFGQTDEVVTQIPVPFATRFPYLLPLPTLWLALTYQATGTGPGDSLLDKVNRAQTYFAANDAGATCRALSGLAHEAQAHDGKNLDQKVARRIVAYAQAIQIAIGCNICD